MWLLSSTSISSSLSLLRWSSSGAKSVRAYCAQKHRAGGGIKCLCASRQTLGQNVALGVLPELPTGCKPTCVHQARLINNAGSLGRGSAAVAAAILLFSCSVFFSCVQGANLLFVFLFFLCLRQIRYASVRMPYHYDMGEDRWCFLPIPQMPLECAMLQGVQTPCILMLPPNFEMFATARTVAQLSLMLGKCLTISHSVFASVYCLIIPFETFNGRDWAYFSTSYRIFWNGETSCGY